MRSLVTLALPFECVVKIGRFEFVFDIFNQINIGIAVCLHVLFLSIYMYDSCVLCGSKKEQLLLKSQLIGNSHLNK